MRSPHHLTRLVLGTTGTIIGIALLLSLKPTGEQNDSVTVSAADHDNAGHLGHSQEAFPPIRALRRTFTGRAYQAGRDYGLVRVRITMAGEEIIAVSGTQDVTSQHSLGIAERAIPLLDSRALAAQRQRIDAVSGASYTSRAYQASLQSAVDQAR